jgi:hypothetical protein
MRSQPKISRQISRLSVVAAASIAVVAVATASGCIAGCAEPPASDPTAEATVRTEALTAGPSSPVHAARPALVEPGRPLGFRGAVAAVRNAPQVSAAEHPGHFSDKGMNKTARRATAGAATPAGAASVASATPPVVSADKMAKQRSYLEQWQQVEPSLAALSQEERDARRAALKKSVLGN